MNALALSNADSCRNIVATAQWAVHGRKTWDAQFFSSSSGRARREASGEGKVWRVLIAGIIVSVLSASPEMRAEIPWPEVAQRLAYENEKLARRAGGHSGEYFVVCTLYFTPKESGFTFERGFDATRVTRRGLRGRTYPRDFLRSVKKEGYGRIITPVNGHNYIRYNDRGSYSFAESPSGGGGTLVPRFSAATKYSGSLRRGLILETPATDVQRVFGSTRWKIVDTGGGLRRWQIDCYYGEDEPLGPGKFMGRPRGTTFEYAYSTARVGR